MRYRRFGRSDLEVSEVGFGVWTLASDWWGVVEDKQGLLHAALDTGINFIDTAPVYGEGGFGEALLADVLKAQRDEIVLTTKCGYDIDAARKFPGQSERPYDWEPASIRLQLEVSLQRLGTDYIDLYQLHNTRIEPIRSDGLWEELEKFRDEGKVRELGVALGPRSAGSTKASKPCAPATSCRCRRCSTCSSRSRGARSRPSPPSPTGASGSSPRAARVRHALGSHHARHGVPPEDHRSHRNRDNMLDNFDKAETLSFLWEGTGRTVGQAAIAGILANPAFTTVLPTCVNVDDVREYSAASDLPLTADEEAESTSSGTPTSG